MAKYIPKVVKAPKLPGRPRTATPHPGFTSLQRSIQRKKA